MDTSKNRTESVPRRRGPMKIFILSLIFVVLLTTHLETSCEAAVLFNPKNLTEYTIRIPALKKPNIFKRLTNSEKSSKKSSHKHGSSKTHLLHPSLASNMRPMFGSSPIGVLPLSSSSSSSMMKAPKGFPFQSLPIQAIPGRGPIPTFKYAGPPIWARDPAAFSRGQFTSGVPPPIPSIVPPQRQSGEHTKVLPYYPGGKISSSKLPQLESQNNMRVVVLRPPYNTLDHSSGDEDRSYGDSSKQRHFGTPGNSKLLEYYQGNRHKGIATGGASLNDVPEIQIINIPPRRGSERRRIFGSQRHSSTRPTVVRLPPNHLRGLQSKFPPGLMIENAPKQFIAEEKTLGDGRNTYIISEVDSSHSDIMNKIRPVLSSVNGNGNSNHIYTSDNHNNGPSDDWNLSLPTTKKNAAFSPYGGNVKTMNNLKTILAMDNNSGFNSHSNMNSHSGPNFGSDYGSLLELQSAKQKLHNSNNFASNNRNNNDNIHYSRNNNRYTVTRYETTSNNNNNNFSPQTNKHPLVIALGGMGKDAWDGHKESSQWMTTRSDNRRPAVAASHERANIQVLRTDKDSKVIVPPGMIAILVPQSFGVTATTGTVTSSGAVDFDDDGQPFYESSSTTKKTVVPSPATLSDLPSNNERIEPSKSPGPPYKVDFTRGLPPNSIAKPEFGDQIQNRMGTKEQRTVPSTSEEVAIQKTSVPIILAASSQKQFSRNNKQQHQTETSAERNLEVALYVNTAQPREHSSRPPAPRPSFQQSTKAPKSKRPHIHPSHQINPNQLELFDEFPQTSRRPSMSGRKTRTTERPNRINYDSSTHKAMTNFPRNHRLQPLPRSFPPAAFDTETAGIYLPRAAALKRNPQNSNTGDTTRTPVDFPQPLAFHGSSRSSFDEVNAERRTGRTFKKTPEKLPHEKQS